MSDDVAQLIRQLRTDDLQQQVDVSNDLSRLGKRPFEPLITLITDEDARDVWWLVVDALRLIAGKLAVQPLIDLPKNPVSLDAMLARKNSAYALSDLADPRALDALIEMLHERVQACNEEENDEKVVFTGEMDHETKKAAAGTLVEIGKWHGIKAVMDCLFEGDHWHVHHLDEWGGDEAFQYILAALETTDPER